jgi:hypothetical protein
MDVALWTVKSQDPVTSTAIWKGAAVLVVVLSMS